MFADQLQGPPRTMRFVQSLFEPWRAVGRSILGVALVIAILGPFPAVAMNLVQPEWVWRIGSDRFRPLAVDATRTIGVGDRCHTRNPREIGFSCLELDACGRQTAAAKSAVVAAVVVTAAVGQAGVPFVE